jgi:hypothetical protein
LHINLFASVAAISNFEESVSESSVSSEDEALEI